MDNNTKNQKGSPSRDDFKRAHKDLSRRFYACDLDFVLVEKFPYPDIVAVLDYKQHGDAITFTETIAYNALVRRGLPVFIVTGAVATGAFRIERYVGGHHATPRTELEFLRMTASWEEFEAWEQSLRDAYRNRFRQ